MAGRRRVRRWSPGEESTDAGPRRAMRARAARLPRRARRRARPASWSCHGACLQGRPARRCSAGRRTTSRALRGMDNCGWAVLVRAPDRRRPAAGGVQRDRASASRRRDPISPAAEARWLRFRELPRTAGRRWGCGAAGSAPAWHAGGQGFESPQLHHSHRSAPVAGPRRVCFVQRVQGFESPQLHHRFSDSPDTGGAHPPAADLPSPWLEIPVEGTALARHLPCGPGSVEATHGRTGRWRAQAGPECRADERVQPVLPRQARRGRSPCGRRCGTCRTRPGTGPGTTAWRSRRSTRRGSCCSTTTPGSRSSPASTARGTPTWRTSSPRGRRWRCSTSIFRHVEGYDGLPDLAAVQGVRPRRRADGGGVRPQLRRHGQGDPEGAARERGVPAGARPPAGRRGPRSIRRCSRCSTRPPTSRDGADQERRPMSDHISGPRALADPIADITDVYAFPSPEQPGRLVLVMNTLPLAKPSDLFSDGLIYRFRLRPARPRRRRRSRLAVRRRRRRVRHRLRLLRPEHGAPDAAGPSRRAPAPRRPGSRSPSG